MKTTEIDVKMIDWFDDHWYKIHYTDTNKVDQTDYLASVTTKLGAIDKPWLAQYYGTHGSREAKRLTAEAGDRGSRIHHAWYTYTDGGAVVYNPDRHPVYTKEELEEIYKKYNHNVCVLRKQDEMYDIMKLQKMCQILKPELKEAEKIVYSIEDRDAGTMDNLLGIKEGTYEVSGSKPLKLPGGLYPFDLKSGKVIDKGAKMQVSRYGILAEKAGYGTMAGALLGHTGATTRTGIAGFSLIYISREEMLELNQQYLRVAKVWEDQFGTAKPKVIQIPGIISRVSFANEKPNPMPDPTPKAAPVAPKVAKKAIKKEVSK